MLSLLREGCGRRCPADGFRGRPLLTFLSWGRRCPDKAHPHLSNMGEWC